MEKMKSRIRTPSISGIANAPGELLFVAGLVIVASVLRLYRIEEKSIWLDESFSLWIARHSLW